MFSCPRPAWVAYLSFFQFRRTCKTLFQSALGFCPAQEVFRRHFVLQNSFPSGGEDTASVASFVFMRVLSFFTSSGCPYGQSQPPNPIPPTPAQSIPPISPPTFCLLKQKQVRKWLTNQVETGSSNSDTIRLNHLQNLA
jgi:hypothetical protein